MKIVKQKVNFHSVYVIIVLIIIALILYIPNYYRLYYKKCFNFCQWNLEDLEKAVTQYKTNNSDEYPLNLTMLIPDYIHEIPICLTQKSLINRITVNQKHYTYQVNSQRSAFTIFCTGENHKQHCGGANLPLVLQQYYLSAALGSIQLPEG